ncbi:MAG: hypothetical protein M3Z24_12335, partial [Chloroflexota bacterium]|nr:hypothetical protein [Chloroflexota bacterium]
MAELVWQGKENNLTRDTQAFSPTLATSEICHRIPDGNTSTLSPANWYSRLIHGDKSFVLPALLPEFENTVDLIYV